MTSVEQGCIDIWIDDIVSCLKDTQTGEIKGISPLGMYCTA